MHKSAGLLWIAGLFGLLAAADAQTPSPPTATSQFDGTYRFVSSSNVNEIYMAGIARVGRCPDNKKAGTLHIMNGQVLLSNGPDYRYEGTVGPQGELAMRLTSPAPGHHAGSTPGLEIMVSGKIDRNGTVRARRMDYRCSYDFIWQKASE
jgi:hypothetical protein